MFSDEMVGVNVPHPPSEQVESIFPILSFPLLGKSVLCWDYVLPHFCVPSTMCHFLRSAHRCSSGEQAYYAFSALMCLRIFFYLLLWSSVSIPSHTQKVQLLSGDSSFCLSITDAQDNEITHLLFSALNIHLACTMFCEHYLDYKFLIQLKGRIQKIHQNDSRKQPQSKLQVADSQCFEAREYLWSYKAR